ncbi:MAG: CoA transferase [Gammaproteobacteria bacterium]|nr:CoA transferase [Gammaproteobacteria bacterium]
MSGALAHLRILDLSRILAGPWATQLLADLGAEVIKVERPGSGDDTRDWGPPYLDDENGGHEAAYFLAANRGKKSVTIDFTRPAGRDLVHRLVAGADVVVENFKAGSLARHGLDYPTLAAINPRLVYCSITGFGHTGPCAGRLGYDFLIQALGGLMSITGEPDGEPQKVGVAVADVLTGLYATVGILAALAWREHSGRGQHIDLALLDVQVATLANQALNYLVSGTVPGRMGNAHPNIVPYQVFAAADGHLVVAVGNDAQFQRLCHVLGRADLATDARYATNADRVRRRDRLIPELARELARAPRARWLADFEAQDIPAGPINSVGEVFGDAQVRARGMAFELARADATPVPQVANPIRLSASPVAYRRAPPRLGEHTGEVLAERLGLGSADLARLRDKGVI